MLIDKINFMYFQNFHLPLKMSKIMLDFVSIFSKGGILLWCYKGKLTKEFNIILIKTYFPTPSLTRPFVI